MFTARYELNLVCNSGETLYFKGIKQRHSDLKLSFQALSQNCGKFRHVCLSAWNDSAPTGRIFMKFDIRVLFFLNLSRNFMFH